MLTINRNQFTLLLVLMSTMIGILVFSIFTQPKGLSPEGVKRIETLITTFEVFSQQSAEMLKEANKNNEELKRYLQSRERERRSVYDEMMYEYLNNFNLGVINGTVPDSDTQSPPINPD